VKPGLLSLVPLTLLLLSFTGSEEWAGIYKYDNSHGGKYAMTTNITMTLNSDKTFVYKFADLSIGALVTTGTWEVKKERLYLYSEKEMDWIKSDSVKAEHRDTVFFYISGKNICMNKKDKCFVKQ